MTHNQHFEINRCSQQINTIEHAHSAQSNTHHQTEQFENNSTAQDQIK